MKVKLSDITKFSKGVQVNGDNLIEDGKYIYLNGGINPSGRWNSFNVKENTVAISEGGNSSGYINYIKEPFWCGAHCYYLFEGPQNSKYLYYALKSQQDRMFRIRSGACMPNIKKSDLGNFEFEFDFDENIQQEIVDVLDRVQGTIDLRKKELQKLDDLVKSRFVEMFGTPYGNEKGFPLLTVDDVIEFTGGAQPDKKYFEYEPTEDNIRLIQIRDYKTDNFITYIPKSMAKRFCDADDIMIGRYGPPIFQILKGIEGSYNVALMKATPKKGNKEFIRYFLKQECLFNYLDGLSQRTAGQSGIEMPALKAYPFPYPPIELQEEFERLAAQVDKSKAAVQKALDEAQLLFDSLMQQYFG